VQRDTFDTIVPGAKMRCLTIGLLSLFISNVPRVVAHANVSLERALVMGTLVAFAAIPGPRARSSQSAYTTAVNICRGSDQYSSRIVARVVSLLTSGDTAEVTLRKAVGITYTALPSHVILTTDETTCGKVLTSINTAYKSRNKARQLYVIFMGQGHAARDPDAGGSIMFVKKQYAFTGALATF
jgi:hypothetical protein